MEFSESILQGNRILEIQQGKQANTFMWTTGLPLHLHRPVHLLGNILTPEQLLAPGQRIYWNLVNRFSRKSHSGISGRQATKDVHVDKLLAPTLTPTCTITL